MKTLNCEVCGCQAAEHISLCLHHLQSWLVSIEHDVALKRPGALRDECILDEALDTYIKRAKRERTWIQ